MKTRNYLIAVAFLAAGLASQARAADSYDVSPGMSYVIFQTKHFGVSTAHGRFNDFSGTVTGDFSNPAESSIEFDVMAASVDTGIEDRDKHLIGPDFFNSKEFPSISFKSTAVAPVEGKENTFTLTGDLTMLGVTKSIEADFVYYGTGMAMGKKPIAGGDASFTVKRTDFGMSYGAPDAIGDDVMITVSIQGYKK
ncbi:MAG: YceI family protein [Verrucomicrobiota bacterium]